MKKSIRIFTAGMLLAASSAPVSGAKTVAQPVITNIEAARSEQNPASLFVSYVIEPQSWEIPSNTEVKVTPVLSWAGGQTELSPVVYAGRNAYMARLRNHDTPKEGEFFRAKGEARQITGVLPWRDEFAHSELTFRSEVTGCRCQSEGTPAMLPVSLALNFQTEPEPLVIPTDQLMAMEQKVQDVVKLRSLSRKAYVNYRVGSTALLPDFRSNPLELAKIIATIDSVRDDKDLTVEKVTIHGFASPEGSWANNGRLAEGRTESLRKYVDEYYGFGDKLSVGFTPEDWAGLREWVSASALPLRGEIMTLIDSDLEPDAKDLRLKEMFPEQYAVMLSQAYPLLRRADYRIDYTVKTFTEPTTIESLLQSDPSKLSFEELMLVARNYPEGSDRRYELMMEAARLFPDDERAQLNAAFQALGRGEKATAARLLEKSGNSPAAQYAREYLNQL